MNDFKGLFNLAMDASDGVFAYYLCGLMRVLAEDPKRPCPDPEAKAKEYLAKYYPKVLEVALKKSLSPAVHEAINAAEHHVRKLIDEERDAAYRDNRIFREEALQDESKPWNDDLNPQ